MRRYIVASGTRPLDVATEFMHLTLEVATEALFSTSVERDVDAIGRAITTLLNEVTFRFTFPLYPPLRVPTPRNRRFLAARATLDGVIYGIITERRRTPGKHDDLLALLMEARDEETGEGMSDRQLRDEVITLFVAGHETTANALTWASYLLCTHVAVLRKVRAEVDEMLQGRIPTAADSASRDGGHGHAASALRYVDDGPPAQNNDSVWRTREVMQPVHVPLWLRPKASPKGEQAEQAGHGPV